MRITSPIIGLFLFITININAQFDIPTIDLETGLIAGEGENLPFWLLSNRYGMHTNDPNQAFGRLSIEREVDKEKVFDYGYGLSTIGRLNNHSDFYFEEWYAELKFHFLKFEAGSKRKILGVQDHNLGSGGILWSGNARPLPEISLSTFNYIDVPYTSGYMQFNGGMSHGWIDDYPGIKDVWLHHKWLMVRSGGDLPIRITGGLHHFAQWGGYSDYYGQLANDFHTLLMVFIANGTKDDIVLGEQINAAGNHLGSYNFRIDYKINDYEAGFYWESIFDDNSGRKLRNLPDGLYGFSFKTNNKENIVNQFIFEYLTTDYQSGSPTVDTINNIPTNGGDNYFSHWIYKMGWSSQLMTIGTPLISSPIYTNSDENIGKFVNNRVKALHFGLGGSFSMLNYKLLYTHSVNKGTYGTSFNPPYQDNSLLIALTFEDFWIEGSSFHIDFGIDIGEFYGNNYGLMLRWEYRFLEN